MRGSVFKRCTCPVKVDARGRKLTCGKQHGSWSYKVDVPGVGGHRAQRVKGGFPTKREAEEAMAEVVTMSARGQLAPRTRMPLADYLDQWLQRVKPTLEASAWTNYRTCLQRYVRAGLGEVPLASLTGVMLSAHYARLLEGGGPHRQAAVAHDGAHRAPGPEQGAGRCRPRRPAGRQPGVQGHPAQAQPVRGAGVDRRAGGPPSWRRPAATGCSPPGSSPWPAACGAASWRGCGGARSTWTRRRSR